MSDSSTTAVEDRCNHRSPLNSLRWIGVVPLAVLAGWLVRGFGRFLLFLQIPGYPRFLFPLMFHLPSGLAFTFVGALVAPRNRLATAICLTGLCMIQSLCIHILTQPNPGLVNYMHSLGELLGATLGVAVVNAYPALRSDDQSSLPQTQIPKP